MGTTTLSPSMREAVLSNDGHRWLLATCSLGITLLAITTEWCRSWIKKLEPRKRHQSAPLLEATIIQSDSNNVAQRLRQLGTRPCTSSPLCDETPQILSLDEVSNLSNSDIRMLPLGDLVATLASVSGISPAYLSATRPCLEMLLEALRTQERARMVEEGPMTDNRKGRICNLDARAVLRKNLNVERKEERSQEMGNWMLQSERYHEVARVSSFRREMATEELRRRGLETQLRRERLRVKTLEEEQEQERRRNEAKRREGECVVCHDREATISILDCGHLCLCGECTKGLIQSSSARCPICRQGIRSTIRIFR